MEAALRESAEREAQANRLKDQFLANLSHELRTPLNVILGYSRTLATRPFQPTPHDVDRINRTIRVIERNATTQLRIVEDLLDVQRIVAGRLRPDYAPCDLRQLAQGVVDSLCLRATAKRLQLQTQARSGGDQLRRRPHSAGDVEPARERRQVHARRTAASTSRSPDGRFGVIRVQDSGEGIPPHFLPYVFERFRQLDMTSTRRHDGLGLGLSIVKHVVELHGGDSDGGKRWPRARAPPSR